MSALEAIARIREKVSPSKKSKKSISSESVREEIAGLDRTRESLLEKAEDLKEQRLAELLDASDERLDALETEARSVARDLEPMLEKQLAEAEAREADQAAKAILAEMRDRETQFDALVVRYEQHVADLVEVFQGMEALAEGYEGDHWGLRNVGRRKRGSGELPNGPIRLLHDVVLPGLDRDAPQWNVLPGRCFRQPPPTPLAEPTTASPPPEGPKVTDGQGAAVGLLNNSKETTEDGTQVVYPLRRPKGTLSRGPGRLTG